MTEMLTAKELQVRLQVDRSTIYRMAESGRLPAIKVGKQWRFPADQVDKWFENQIASNHALPKSQPGMLLNGRADKLPGLLPMECVQLIQDTFADLLGVMLVVTDIEGRPITSISNRCQLFDVVSKDPQALEKCIQSWGSLASEIDLEPKFSESHLGLLCARAMVRVGTELQGMVVAGCVRPDDWPPNEEKLSEIASEMQVDVSSLSPHLADVYSLTKDQRKLVLTNLQKIANIVAHIVDDHRHRRVS